MHWDSVPNDGTTDGECLEEIGGHKNDLPDHRDQIAPAQLPSKTPRSSSKRVKKGISLTGNS